MRLRPELPLNPGEQSVLTANRVNVRNRKCKKELASKQKGIENAMRCDNVLHSRESAIMHDRLSRLTVITGTLSRPDDRIAPLSSASPTHNMKPEDFRRLSSRDSTIAASRLSSRENYMSYSPVSSIDVQQYECVADSAKRPPTEDRQRRHVHFSPDRMLSSGPGRDYQRTRRRSEPVFYRNRDSLSDLRNESIASSLPTLQFHGVYSDGVRTDEDSARSHGDDRDMRRGRSGSLFVGTTRGGFSSTSSQASGLTPRNSLKALSGLEEELARFRRLHHTRAVNARIKAVRSGGKRHPPCLTLRERMDQEAMLRKEQALCPQPFGAAEAWSLLNCGYLRLTANNIATLEEMCSRAGYDVSSHPHKHTRSTSAVNSNDVSFKDLQESHLSKPDLRSQLQFRQNMLMRRFSEGFNSIH